MPFLITVLLAKNRLLKFVLANGVSRTYSSSSSSLSNVVDVFCDEEEMKRMARMERMVASLSKL